MRKYVCRFLFIIFTSVNITTLRADTISMQWLNEDGTTYDTTTCNAGDDVILPATPTKRGYTFMGWSKATPIEYLESTGTQYIDTGFVPNQDTGVRTKFRTSDCLTVVFGSGISYTTTNFELYFNSVKNNNECTIEFNYNGYQFAPGINGDTTFEINWDKNIINYSINNIQQTTVTFSYSYFVSPYSLLLFGDNRPGGTFIYNNKKLLIYYFKLYDNDILVRDFIPVLDPNGVPCMYDKISEQFFYNQGTGDFIAGPVINE